MVEYMDGWFVELIVTRSRARFLHILADRPGGPHRLFVCERWASSARRRGKAACQRGTVYGNRFQGFGDCAPDTAVAPGSPCSAFSTTSFFLPDRTDRCSATDGHQPLLFSTR